MEQPISKPLSELSNNKRWQKTDMLWVMGLYGTAIGAGVLFLPINAGSGGLIPLVIMSILVFPMTFYSHRGLARFVLAGSQRCEDITDVADEHFGAGAGKTITGLYFLAIFPIMLVYGVAITNTAETFLIHQLEVIPPPRALLSLLLITGIIAILSVFGKKIVKIMSFLVFVLIAALMFLAVYLIPHWNISILATLCANPAKGPEAGIWMTLWLAVPVLIFSFNHSPIISSFVLTKREEYGIEAEQKCNQILAAAHVLMVVTVMFFVFSCVLSLSPQDLLAAKEQNISVLSYLANHLDSSLIAWMAPVTAMVAVTNSFMGHYQGAREGVNGLVEAFLRRKEKKVSPCARDMFSTLFISGAIWIAATFNPGILVMIETLSGPVIALILFIIPVYAIHKVPAMHKYRGNFSNVFVLLMGGIAVSAICFLLIQ